MVLSAVTFRRSRFPYICRNMGNIVVLWGYLFIQSFSFFKKLFLCVIWTCCSTDMGLEDSSVELLLSAFTRVPGIELSDLKTQRTNLLVLYAGFYFILFCILLL